MRKTTPNMLVFVVSIQGRAQLALTTHFVIALYSHLCSFIIFGSLISRNQNYRQKRITSCFCSNFCGGKFPYDYCGKKNLCGLK
jgi:hypothetical protein